MSTQGENTVNAGRENRTGNGRYNIMMDSDLHTAGRKLAKARGKPFSDLLSSLVRNELRRQRAAETRKQKYASADANV